MYLYIYIYVIYMQDTHRTMAEYTSQMYEPQRCHCRTWRCHSATESAAGESHTLASWWEKFGAVHMAG